MRMVSDDAGQPAGIEGFQHVLGSDDADDRAHDTAADERLPAVRLDVLDDDGKIGVSGGRCHHDDHPGSVRGGSSAIMCRSGGPGDWICTRSGLTDAELS